mgnify:CR=1 FL=1
MVEQKCPKLNVGVRFLFGVPRLKEALAGKLFLQEPLFVFIYFFYTQDKGL